MENWIELLEWPAMAVTVLAAWCIGSHRPGRRMVGFCCFIASNLLWSVWGWQAEAWALIVLQVVLFLMNLRGWRKNKNTSKSSEGGSYPPGELTRSDTKKPISNSVGGRIID